MVPAMYDETAPAYESANPKSQNYTTDTDCKNSEKQSKFRVFMYHIVLLTAKQFSFVLRSSVILLLPEHRCFI
jgi:hypothetical protein